MTDSEFISWLKSAERIPCVLVEAVAQVGGVETTRYLSNTGYTTGPAETPASTHYASCIVGGARIAERLSLDGDGASMAFGDVELDNTEGDLDDWISDVWTNRQLRMYVGDMRWARADFRLVFDGITANLISRSRDRMNLVVRDKLQRLNTAVSARKLGGTGANADRLLPLCFGDAHNVQPLLVDKALLKYQVHDGPIERIIEVRDNGIVVAHTPDLATGTFRLSASPVGVITCSAQGAKTPAGAYVNTASTVIALLATEYGTDPFSVADLDAANLAAFNVENPQPIAVYLTERENVLALCQQLAASVGAQAVMSTTGKLRLIKLTVPVAGTVVTAANMAERSLRIADRIPVVAAVKLGYCKNWTVQDSLDTGIPPEHKALYAQEWLTVTAANASVALTYKLTQEPEQANTLMVVREDALTETARLLALWREPRDVFAYEGMPELLLEELGGYQTVTHSRFRMADGTDVQIVGVERDWLSMRASFSVISGGALPGGVSPVGGGGDTIGEDTGDGDGAGPGESPPDGFGEPGPANIGLAWANRVQFGDARLFYFYRGSYEGLIVRALASPHAMYRHWLFPAIDWPVDSEAYSAAEAENRAIVSSGGLGFRLINIETGGYTAYTLAPPVGADADLGTQIFGHCYLNGKYVFATRGASVSDRVGLWIVDPAAPGTVEAAYAANTGAGTLPIAMRAPPGGTGSSVYVLSASRVTKHALASATPAVNLGAASGGSSVDVDPYTGNIWTAKLASGNLTVTAHSPTTGLLGTHGPSASSMFALTNPQPFTFTPSDGVYVTGALYLATDYFHRYSSDGASDVGVLTGAYHGTADRQAILHNPLDDELLAFRFGGSVTVGDPSDITTVAAGAGDWYIATP